MLNVKDIVSSGRWDYDYNQIKYVDFEKKLQSIETDPLQSFCKQSITKGETPLWKGDKYVTEEEGVLFIRSENIREYGLDLNSKTFISTDVHERMQRSQIQAGDVLLAIVGATIGQVSVVPDEIEEANCNQAVAIIRPKEDVNPYYLMAILQSTVGQTQIHRLSGGTARPNLDLWEARILRIPVVSESLQDQIAQVMQEAYSDRRKKLVESQRLLDSIDGFILEALDIKFDNLRRETRFILASREIVKNRFDVDFHLPETHDRYEALQCSRKCRVASLGTLIDQIANGATPKGANYLNEGIPFFRIQNIVPDGLDLSDIAYISRETHDEMKRSQTRPGDLLMTITGRVGTAAVIPGSLKEGNINQHIVIIRLKSDVINTNYLATVINSSAVSFQASHRTTGTTRIALDYTAIKSLLIPVPTIEIQEQILGEVARRRSEAKRLRNEAEAVVAAAKARVERMILGEEGIDEN